LKGDDFELRIIPGYHEEEAFDPKPSDTFERVYQFVWQSKTWLYFGYTLAYDFLPLLFIDFYFIYSFILINEWEIEIKYL